MTKKVIYASFAFRHHNKIAEYLLKKYQWKPVYWTGYRDIEKEVKSSFPDTTFHATQEVRRGRLIDFVSDKGLVPVDRQIINSLSRYESSALKMMRRIDTTGWNFSHDERMRHYYKMLTYWNTVIYYLKPDIFVSWVVPHSSDEFILYQLCKYYEIKTLFVEPNASLEKYFYVGASIEDKTSVFKNIYYSECDLQISDETKMYLKRLRSSEGIVPKYMKTKKNINKAHRAIHRILYLVKRLVQLLKMGKGMFAKSDSHYKCNKYPIESSASEMNYLQALLFDLWIIYKNYRLDKIYSSFTIKPDLIKKYVYFAPNYQHEATTLPDAGIYVDYFLILDILSACIPDDWVIYYKEHPSTFNLNMRGCLARNRDYYKRISRYNNVKMIASSINTFELIDNSQAVATPSGTVGWEAVVRGKPALVFGQAWYVGCKSVFKIDTYDNCIDAIKKTQGGFKPDQADIERYAAAIEQVAEKDLIVRDFVKRTNSCRNLEFEMQRIAKAIYRAYEAHYQ